MTRRIGSLTFALALFALVAADAQAAAAAGPNCTREYEQCIAASPAPTGGADVTDEMAYLECAVEWVGCVRKKLLPF